MTEKTRYRDFPSSPTSLSPLPLTCEQPMTSISPPLFLPQTQSAPIIDVSIKRLHKRALLTTSKFHADETIPSNSRASRTSKDTAATITETELTDNLSAMDALNVAGAAAGFVSTGYAAASFYSQRRAEKEAKKREQDLEAAVRGVAVQLDNADLGSSRSASVTSSEDERNEGKVPEPGQSTRQDLAWTGMR